MGYWRFSKCVLKRKVFRSYAAVNVIYKLSANDLLWFNWLTFKRAYIIFGQIVEQRVVTSLAIAIAKFLSLPKLIKKRRYFEILKQFCIFTVRDYSQHCSLLKVGVHKYIFNNLFLLTVNILDNLGPKWQQIDRNIFASKFQTMLCLTYSFESFAK